MEKPKRNTWVGLYCVKGHWLEQLFMVTCDVHGLKVLRFVFTTTRNHGLQILEGVSSSMKSFPISKWPDKFKKQYWNLR